MMMPLVSIVIANYNYGRFLEEAIWSVLSQSCQDFELIVVDGGSTDESVGVIRKHEDRISWWVSERDRGQSHAFNKGFARARGRFLTWLNADDVMLPGTIAKLNAAAERNPQCEWFVGGCFWLDPEMRIVNCGRGRAFSEVRYREGNVCVWGPSSFFTKRLLDAVGGVDERFHYSMDADLWLRFACKAGARYLPFCDYAWGLRLHPDAKMSRHNFTVDGRLALGARPAMDRRQQDAEEQKCRERGWRAEYFKPRPGNWLTHLISASWRLVMAARIDLWRYGGRHYGDYFA